MLFMSADIFERLLIITFFLRCFNTAIIKMYVHIIYLIYAILCLNFLVSSYYFK
jgi:hypothetical protein